MPTDLSIVKKPFTESENKVLRDLTKPGTLIDVSIADDIAPKEWKVAANVVCRGVKRAQMQEKTLLPILGRLLSVAKEHKDIQEGYDTWDEFLKGEIYEKYDVGRSSVYEALQMARFKHLPIEELEPISRRNMRLICQVVGPGKEKQATAKSLVEKAADMSDADFRGYLVSKNLIGKGDSQGAHIIIGCSQKVQKMWEKFSTDPRICAYCETEHAGLILEKMMQECADWKAAADGTDEGDGAEPEQTEATA
jgi:hypothetical protein